jgi:hypothetical protein
MTHRRTVMTILKVRQLHSTSFLSFSSPEDDFEEDDDDEDFLMDDADDDCDFDAKPTKGKPKKEKAANVKKEKAPKQKASPKPKKTKASKGFQISCFAIFNNLMF